MAEPFFKYAYKSQVTQSIPRGGPLRSDFAAALARPNSQGDKIAIKMQSAPSRRRLLNELSGYAAL
jgi:hypothetical protein